MKEYRFSIGSKRLGLCFSIVADTEDEAVTMAAASLDELCDGIDADPFGGVEGVRVYMDSPLKGKALRELIVDVTPLSAKDAKERRRQGR